MTPAERPEAEGKVTGHRSQDQDGPGEQGLGKDRVGVSRGTRFIPFSSRLSSLRWQRAPSFNILF